MTPPKGHCDPSSIIVPSSRPIISTRLLDEEEQHDGALKVEEPPTLVDARLLAQRIAADLRVGRDPTRADLELVVKTAKLCALGEIPEHFVHAALSAVKHNRPRNPRSYFHTCMDNALGGAGELNRMFASLGDLR